MTARRPVELVTCRCTSDRIEQRRANPQSVSRSARPPDYAFWSSSHSVTSHGVRVKLSSETLPSPPQSAEESPVATPIGNTAAARQSRRRRVVCVGLACLFWVGLLVRLTIADRILGASTLFYAMPWSVLAVMAAILWRMERKRGHIRASSRWLAAGLLCGLIWAWRTWYARGDNFIGRTARVVVWNVAHGKHGFVQTIEALAEMNPDVAIVVEGDPRDEDIRGTFQKAFPDHQVSILGGGLVLVSRWPSGTSSPYQIGEDENECRVREIDVDTPYGKWTIFGIDLGSSPFYDRGMAFRELAKLIERRNDHAVIVAGDFNTPLDSVHYQHFRDLGLREAFQTAGSGYLPTWPLPVPVLSLDQLWMNEHLTPVRCVREWSIRSDHAAVIGFIR